MLFSLLGSRRQATDEADQILERVRGSPELRREIGDLLDILADRIRTVSRPLDPASEVPLQATPPIPLGKSLLRTDTPIKRGALVFPQGGVLWNKATQTDLLFVTLEKSDKDYSPTTRYADYPISPDPVSLGVAEHGVTGYAHGTPLHRATRPTHERRLFVRERKKGWPGRNPSLPLPRPRSLPKSRGGTAHEDIVGAGTAYARVALSGRESGRGLRH